MRHVRFSAAPSPKPALFDLLAATDWVHETRLVNLNLANERPVGLFVVTADRERFEATLAALPEVIASDITPIDSDQFAVHLTLELPSNLSTLFDALTTGGLVLVRPVVYHDSAVHGSIVGQPTDVRTALDELPSILDLNVESVGVFDVRRETPIASRLSDRQLEAARTAVELGYYESPRRTTHAEIATELDCSPSTATEHLQKAEAKLVTGALAAYLK